MAKFSYDHIHIISETPLESSKFYQKMFGARVLKELHMPKPDGRTIIELDVCGTKIVMSNLRPDEPQLPGAPDTGINHLSLFTDSVDDAVEELAREGATLLKKEEPQLGIKLATLIIPQNVLLHIVEIDNGKDK